MGAIDELRRGRDAHAGQRWAAAVDALTAADAGEPLGAADVELLATALFMVGREEEHLGVSISCAAVRLTREHPLKEDVMKYMLLIHQGDTPTPRDPEAWASLSEDEQKRVFADYQALNQTPGVWLISP